MSNLQSSNKKPLSVIQFYLSTHKNNYIKCSKCDRKTHDGHFYAISFYKLEKDTNIYWKGKYKIGCTHDDYDGESWCDGCYTIMNNKIMCSSCSNIRWMVPSVKNIKDTYTWINGSESSYSKPLFEKDLL